MRRFYILNDGTTAVTESAEMGSPVGIKEVYDISSLCDEEFRHLLEQRPEFAPVTDHEGKLTALKSPQRIIQITQGENI